MEADFVCKNCHKGFQEGQSYFIRFRYDLSFREKSAEVWAERIHLKDLSSLPIKVSQEKFITREDLNNEFKRFIIEEKVNLESIVIVPKLCLNCHSKESLVSKKDWLKELNPLTQSVKEAKPDMSDIFVFFNKNKNTDIAFDTFHRIRRDFNMGDITSVRILKTQVVNSQLRIFDANTIIRLYNKDDFLFFMKAVKDMKDTDILRLNINRTDKVHFSDYESQRNYTDYEIDSLKGISFTANSDYKILDITKEFLKNNRLAEQLNFESKEEEINISSESFNLFNKKVIKDEELDMYLKEVYPEA